MATWQEGNGGGFLSGIGTNNTNAPQVSDVNATLGMIRENNDIQRSGANNIGLQALQGLGSVAQSYQQEKQAERQKEFQSAYSSAYASGDRNAMRQLAMQYPDQFEAVRNGMGFIDEDQRNTIGNLASTARLAAQSPEAMGEWLKSSAGDLARVGINPGDVATMYQQNPQGFGEFADHLGMSALGPEKYFDLQDKAVGREIDRGKLAETVRSNQAGESLQGQQIAVSRENSIRSASGQNSQPASVKEYQYFQSLSPEQQKTYMRVRGRPDAGGGNNTVQLADGRTVEVTGKLHGSGSTAFYDGIDDSGNMVRVPASAIAAPPTSAATAQNFAMSKDLDSIANASPESLEFMTGVTGGSGSPAFGADVRSRLSGKDQRQIYNAAQRIQGKMQNQGIAAARDMGASGINTVAEAKMYFQGMPQFDFSSPEAAQQSIRLIREYTDNYNQQYQVDVGNGGKKTSRQQQTPQQPAAGGGFSNLWGG
ncbi:phage DNA ejection protein [Yersinia aleksiciae]|uniref:DNA transfer protein n=1 Tax=Yersinia aleksiciae TaxID=263819 RepID=A0ABN4H9B6_YERAE|nr:phage DNA ejection protein [Yersinia aleksiciae]AKP34719.1 DNA transfer protein [Yersinia aleksiciae]CFQ47828.1 Uncharacterised protein [Yersinia aleksiciae]